MSRPRPIDWALLAVAAAVYAWLQGWNAWHGINSNDFKHIYLGMKALLDGISPYSFNALHHQAALQGYSRISLNPYVYLPFTGHAMAFLAPLRLEHAVVAWFILNHIFVGASLWLLSNLWPARRLLAMAGLLFLMAISFPLYRTLTAGQLNLALLFLICVARWQMQRDQPRIAGGVLAFAALYKLMPGIFGLCLLLRRRWQAAISMTVAGLVLLTLSTLAAGLKISAEFIPVLGQMGYGKSTWPEVFSFWDDPTNQSLNSFFTHILAVNDHTTPWISAGQTSANLATVVAVAILVITYVFTIFQRGPRPRGFSPADDHAWSATLMLGLLIPSLMWDHYLVMLILPIATLAHSTIKLRRIPVLIITALCYIAVCVPWHFDNPRWTSGPGIILMSLKLWPTLVLFGLTLCFVRIHRLNGGENQ